MEKYSCYFSSNVEILGVYGDKMIIDGWVYDEDKDEDTFGIVVSIEGYKKGMDMWIKDKKEYCERLGYNCGVGVIMGECEGKTIILGGEEYIDCVDVEWEVDLEHG